MVGNNACVDLPVYTPLLPTQTTSPLTSTGSGVTLPSWHHYRYRHHDRLHRDSTHKLPISNRTGVRIANSLYIVKPKDAQYRYDLPNTNTNRRRPAHRWPIRHTHRRTKISSQSSIWPNRATNPLGRNYRATAHNLHAQTNIFNT